MLPQGPAAAADAALTGAMLLLLLLSVSAGDLTLQLASRHAALKLCTQHTNRQVCQTQDVGSLLMA
jgi:hypothetical protein